MVLLGLQGPTVQELIEKSKGCDIVYLDFPDDDLLEILTDNSHIIDKIIMKADDETWQRWQCQRDTLYHQRPDAAGESKPAAATVATELPYDLEGINADYLEAQAFPTENLNFDVTSEETSAIDELSKDVIVDRPLKSEIDTVDENEADFQTQSSLLDDEAEETAMITDENVSSVPQDEGIDAENTLIQVARTQKICVCKYCGKEFAWRSILTKHLNTQHRGQLKKTDQSTLSVKSESYNVTYKCDICPDAEFIKLDELFHHTDAEHPRVKHHSCTVCSRKYRSVNRWKTHMQTHSLDELHSCSCCAAVYNQYDAFARHLQEHADVLTFLCENCDLRFAESGQLEEHRRNEHGIQCVLCQSIVTSASEFDEHLQEFHPHCFKCDASNCNLVFAEEISLKEHQTTFHTSAVSTPKTATRTSAKKKSRNKYRRGDANISCEFCERSFNRVDHYKLHMMNHTGGRPHVCKVCPKTFKTRNELKKHALTHEDNTYTCVTCDKKFAREVNLLLHMKKHTGENLYNCDVCGKQWTTKHALKTHMYVHSDVKPFVCDLCGKQFLTNSNLQKHVASAHPPGVDDNGLVSFACETCGQMFSSFTAVKRHMKRHVITKEHHCSTCNRYFATKHTLNDHIRIHEGKARFRCETCDKGFNRRQQLTEHVMIHTGLRPFACEACPKVFTSARKLENHVRVHTGERPFKCSVCETTFTRNDKMMAHFKKMHKATKLELLISEANNLSDTMYIKIEESLTDAIQS